MRGPWEDVIEQFEKLAKAPQDHQAQMSISLLDFHEMRQRLVRLGVERNALLAVKEAAEQVSDALHDMNEVDIDVLISSLKALDVSLAALKEEADGV